MSRNNSLAKNTLLLSIGTMLTKGLSFLMVPFFSKWLSASDYGIFDLLSTYVMLLLPIIGLSSNEAVFRFSMDAKCENEKKKYITNSLMIFTINSGILLIVLWTAKIALGWELALYFFILSIGEIYNLHLRGFLRAIKRLDIYSFANAIITLATAVVTPFLILGVGLQLEGIILGYGLGYIIGDIIIVVWTRYWRYISVKCISVEGMKELIQYSYALIPNSLAWWFINVSDRTIINAVLGPASTGVFAIAHKIPNILSSVFSVFSVSWQQAATEALDNEERNRYYNAIYNKMTIVLLSLCCGVLSLNSWLFNFVFDPKYFDAYLYAPVLITGTVFATISQYYGSLQISFKQPKENGITTVIGAGVNIVVHLAMIHAFGLFAAAISTLVSQLIVCMLRNYRLRRFVKIQFSSETMVYFVVYILFLISAYYITNQIFNIVSVIIASIVVLWANRDFVGKVMTKVKKQ